MLAASQRPARPARPATRSMPMTPSLIAAGRGGAAVLEAHHPADWTGPPACPRPKSADASRRRSDSRRRVHPQTAVRVHRAYRAVRPRGPLWRSYRPTVHTVRGSHGASRARSLRPTSNTSYMGWPRAGQVQAAAAVDHTNTPWCPGGLGGAGRCGPPPPPRAVAISISPY